MFEFYGIVLIIILIIFIYFKSKHNNENDFDFGSFYLKNKVNNTEDFDGYPNGWYLLSTSAELNKNQIKGFTFAGNELVLFRGNSGKVHVLDAYCPHLGANIGYGGKVSNYDGMDCITCPFHGWAFEGENGKCVRIPNIDSQDIPTNAKMKTWRVLEQGHLIYLWMHAEGVEPTHFPDNLIDKYDFDMSKPFKCSPQIYHDHIQCIFENAFDFSHFEYIHHTFIPGIWTMKYESKMMDNEYFDHIHKRFKALITGQIYIFGIRIGYLELSVDIYGPFVGELVNKTKVFGLFTIKTLVLYQLTPIAPNVTRMVFYVYGKKTLISGICARIVSFQVPFLTNGDQIVFDYMKPPKKPVFVKTDKPFVEFRNWLKKYKSK